MTEGPAGLAPRNPARERTVPHLVARVAVAVLVVTIFAVLIGLQLSAQSQAQSSLRQRYVARAQTAAQFMHSFVVDTLSHERRLAARRLASPALSSTALDQFDQDLFFSASMVLAPGGRVVAVSSVDSMGSIARVHLSSYLARAFAGVPGVSDVTAAMASPGRAVAFATSFRTPEGLRVVSASLALHGNELTPYVDASSSLPESQTFLVDRRGRVIASSVGAATRARPRPFAAIAVGSSRVVSGRFDTAVGVPGTPWRIDASVPLAVLYAPVHGQAEIVPWLLVLAALMLTLVAAVYLTRRWESQRQRAIGADVDALTGLSTRRFVAERASEAISGARRNGLALSFVLFDVDHFKEVNDHFGHGRGDEVLRDVAQAIAGALRAEDVGARWGGEEFLVMLPYVTATGAAQVAERVRRRVGGLTRGPTGGDALSISAGVASLDGDSELDDVVRRADLALYEAKSRGRDQVVVYDDVLEPGAVPSE